MDQAQTKRPPIFSLEKVKTTGIESPKIMSKSVKRSVAINIYLNFK
ncbi:hypothetical protein MmTuc01_0956 [Methanosarcina mazei Tuc01]|uniref:Uncharacterized protein n=1 Tax=Methanosarcina mazei Tuc01 TaxID=1236903 RepID=M1PVU5_METMZ|nr:hypothetical protein MmTuc01_0956 [Methanosarcina mazei Tuc01]